MKKILITLLSFILMLSFSSCGNTAREGNENAKEDTVKILCVDFPEYDWTKNIVGDSDCFSIELLNDSGADLHSYQPSVNDIASICDCDILIYNGGESETWIDDAWKNDVYTSESSLKDSTEKIAINLMTVFQESQLFDSYEDNDDEHLWLSPRLAKEISAAICEVVKHFDPENIDIYDNNYVKYANELDLLGTSYSELFLSYPVLIADRMPFYYLFADAGIESYAAFDGCSAESEASFETIVALANVIKEKDLTTVFYIDGSTDEIAKSVIQAAETPDAEIEVLNSMQSLSSKDISAGADYISIMKANLELIKKLEG